MRSLSLTGFMLTNYSEHFQEYFGQLIPKVHKGEIKVAVDLGEQTSEGKFFGLEQVVRAEEVSWIIFFGHFYVENFILNFFLSIYSIYMVEKILAK